MHCTAYQGLIHTEAELVGKELLGGGNPKDIHSLRDSPSSSSRMRTDGCRKRWQFTILPTLPCGGELQ